jgi:hypothetical protein
MFTGVDSNIPLGNSPRTIEAWVRLSGLGATLMTVAEYGSLQPWKRFSLMVNNNIGHVYFSNYAADINGSILVNDGLWHKITLTYDGTYVGIYVDGRLDVRSATPPSNQQFSQIDTSGDTLMIGLNNNSYQSEQFYGDIAAVAIYDRELPVDMIANPQLPSGAERGLVSYYNLDQFRGGSAGITDLIGHSDTLSASGF